MNRIRERRLELGMKQTELSAILREADPRIDTAMISRFECGVCLPTEPVLEALESAMQTDRAALYDPDELADEQRVKIATELKIRYMNELQRGKAVFRAAEGE